jgi:hypothetical protein
LKTKRVNSIDDLTGYQVTFQYGSKPLSAIDPILIEVIRRAIQLQLQKPIKQEEAKQEIFT